MKILVYFVLLTIGIPTCNKCKHYVNPVSQLPPATQTGQNTLGCVMNGKPWTPRAGLFYFGSILSATYDSTRHTFSLFSVCYREKEDINQDISIYVDSVYSTGLYTLYNSTDNGAFLEDNNTNCPYITDSLNTGTFYFKVIVPGCGTMNVTDGRFDVRSFY
jgi:hypothetical protein